VTKTDCSDHPGISLFISYVQNFIHHPSVKVNVISRWNFWASSVCILM